MRLRKRTSRRTLVDIVEHFHLGLLDGTLTSCRSLALALLRLAELGRRSSEGEELSPSDTLVDGRLHDVFGCRIVAVEDGSEIVVGLLEAVVNRSIGTVNWQKAINVERVSKREDEGDRDERTARCWIGDVQPGRDVAEKCGTRELERQRGRCAEPNEAL